MMGILDRLERITGAGKMGDGVDWPVVYEGLIVLGELCRALRSWGKVSGGYLAAALESDPVRDAVRVQEDIGPRGWGMARSLAGRLGVRGDPANEG